MTSRSNRQELVEIARKARRLLDGMAGAGVQGLPVKVKKRLSQEERLEPIRRRALVCRACRLCEGRQTVVFGEGSLNAKLVFVGEGPGRDEDLQGRPFVGAAGQLLNKMIAAMDLTRESVYIANVVKCRPPMNRPPQPDEIASCLPYLKAQLGVIAPRVICALGKTAACALLGSEQSIQALRNRDLLWEGIPLVVTFHPAYLLRNPSAKGEAWKDLQRLMALL